MRRFTPLACVLAAALAAPVPASAADGVTVSRAPRVGSGVSLSFRGPESSETGQPNPFRDVVAWVVFRREDHVVTAPAFFAADGDAANSRADAGDVWRAWLLPDRAGKWEYTVFMHEAKDAAITGPPLGVELAPKYTGSFVVDAAPKDAPFRGVLRHAGGRYLRFANGDYWIKAGVDSPENFLAYFEFDGTPPTHKYLPHEKDFRRDDLRWRSAMGRWITGAVNYLADAGVNSVYMITMNINGDGKDVWPFVSDKPADRDRFDCSKLDQWNVLFTHMNNRGVALHLLLQETENDKLLDGGDPRNLGPLRKLYLRELVARFAHHPMLIWNLGEENTQTTDQQKAMADYIRSLDPYDHPIVLHTYPNQHEKVYAPLLGHASIDGPSVQTDADVSVIHKLVRTWVERSAKADHPWAVFIDEPGSAQIGAAEDGAIEKNRIDMIRHALWGNLLAGGAGVEWYFGYKRPHHDLNLEDFRPRDALYRSTAAAVKLFHDELPFWEMNPVDGLTGGAATWCFAKPDAVYVVYIPVASRGAKAKPAATLNLPAGRWSVRWVAAATSTGPPAEVIDHPGGELRLAVHDTADDAVALIKRAE